MEALRDKSRNMEPGTRRTILVAAFALIALLSFTVIGNYASSAEQQAGTISKLDEKKETVLRLSAAATATSVAITMVPGDAATPIAEQIAELTKYFLLILCAVFLEKYLLTTMGYISFKILIPIAMAMLIVYLFRRNEAIKRMALRIIVFAIAFYFVIPFSVLVTSKIEQSYEKTMQDHLESLESVNAEITEDAAEDTAEVEETEEEEKKGGLLSGLTGIGETISNAGETLITNITQASSAVLEKLEDAVNKFIETIAVMILTNCVIPVLVLLAIVYMAKSVLNSVMVRIR